MKFNVTFMGPEHISHLRRDLMLLLQYALEDLGHDVTLSYQAIEPRQVNIVIGGYFLAPEALKTIMQSGAPVIHLNSEIIANDMMNYNPKKVDFMGSYLPFLRYGYGVMETVIDNESELTRYGLKHNFLRWAYHEKLSDVAHKSEKDLDYYLFGFITPRRTELLNRLVAKGYYGAAHHICPYFVRNSYIGRAKIHLNIIQDDKYTHVNCYRIGFLNNNACAILSEQENDPAGFLKLARVCTKETFVDEFAELLSNDNWKKLGEQTFEEYKKIHITPLMEASLEHLLGAAAKKASA